jgi:hypothetical protein
MRRACSTCRIQDFGRKPEGKIPVERFRRTWEGNIRVDIRATGSLSRSTQFSWIEVLNHTIIVRRPCYVTTAGVRHSSTVNQIGQSIDVTDILCVPHLRLIGRAVRRHCSKSFKQRKRETVQMLISASSLQRVSVATLKRNMFTVEVKGSTLCTLCFSAL